MVDLELIVIMGEKSKSHLIKKIDYIHAYVV